MLTLKEILEKHQKMIEEGKKRREKLMKERGNRRVYKKEELPVKEIKAEEKPSKEKKPSKKKKSKKEENVEILDLNELNK